MKIKKDYQVVSTDFWYDLTYGGYLKPDEILEDPEDARRVRDAVAVLWEFEKSCPEQIGGFEL